MIKKADCYKYLNLDPKVALTIESLKTAYKTVVRQWHPDLNPHRIEEATERFKAITVSYSTLCEMIEYSDGAIKGTLLSSKDFFHQFGFDRLAELTNETLVEINLERAAMGLSAAEGSGTAAMIDSKLMKKLLLWARGPDFSDNVHVLDEHGHFTDKAVINILEWASVYEMSSMKGRRNRMKKASDEEDEGEEWDARLGQIIRDWIHENYLSTATEGYVHKSRYKYWLVKTQSTMIKNFKALGLPEEVLGNLCYLVSTEDFPKAAKDMALYFESIGGEDLAKTTSKSVIKSAEKAKNQLDDEIASLALRVKVSKEVLIASAKNQSDENEENPALSLVGDRVKELLLKLESTEEIINQGKSKEGSHANKVSIVLSDLKAIELNFSAK